MKSSNKATTEVSKPVSRKTTKTGVAKAAAPKAPDIPSIVDALGDVRAKLADLEKREKELKQTLIDSGPGEYEGHLFKANVSTGSRTTLDTENLKKILDPAILQKFSRVSAFTQVKVMAR
jgi:hypothetical protein